MCERSGNFCECMPNRTACLAPERASGGCAWITCLRNATIEEDDSRPGLKANADPDFTLNFCAAMTPGASSTSCEVEVGRAGGTRAQFFYPKWTPFWTVVRTDPRANLSFWRQRGEDRNENPFRLPGGSGHHGPTVDEDGHYVHVHEAGPEVWPTMLCCSMFLANVQTIILVALHSEWSIQVKRTGDGRPIIEMLRQLCIASIHLVIMLGVATESGIELLCKPGDLGNPSFFTLLSLWYDAPHPGRPRAGRQKPCAKSRFGGTTAAREEHDMFERAFLDITRRAGH